MIKRSEYMNNSSELHHAYYMQFVNDSIKCAVIRLCENGKRKWYNIPLNEWDSLHSFVVSHQSAKKCRELIDTYNYKDTPPGRFIWSFSDSICVLKNAAIAIYGNKPCEA